MLHEDNKKRKYNKSHSSENDFKSDIRELKADIRAFRTDLKTDMMIFKNDIKDLLREQKSDSKWLFNISIGLHAIAISGILAILLK